MQLYRKVEGAVCLTIPMWDSDSTRELVYSLRCTDDLTLCTNCILVQPPAVGELQTISSKMTPYTGAMVKSTIKM